MDRPVWAQTDWGRDGGRESDGIMASRGRGEEEKRSRGDRRNKTVDWVRIVPVCCPCWCWRGRMRRCGPRLPPIASLAPRPIGRRRSSSCWPGRWRWWGCWTLTSLQEKKKMEEWMVAVYGDGYPKVKRWKTGEVSHLFSTSFSSQFKFTVRQ